MGFAVDSCFDEGFWLRLIILWCMQLVGVFWKNICHLVLPFHFNDVLALSMSMCLGQVSHCTRVV
jgi:hypothetical protein